MSSQIPIKKIKIEIDKKSGFCFGVSRAVELAEKQLNSGIQLTCLGDIVHNEEEVDRLHKKGMQTVSPQSIDQLTTKTVLFRAHGEPPSSYKIMKSKGVSVIDATCPVVIKLQQRINAAWNNIEQKNGQIVIYGKSGHAEVIGLLGQTNNEALVVESINDIVKLAPEKYTELFSQTTMSYAGFEEIETAIKTHLNKPELLKTHRTICAQVGNRVPYLTDFSKNYDVIIFVGGAKSSNAKVLFEACKKNNDSSYFVSSCNEIKSDWFAANINSVGICGATSTPDWLMKDVSLKIESIVNNK
jgi:4-hydroxy-3-methylbut-2-en-1-yl diphosphate reductase